MSKEIKTYTDDILRYAPYCRDHRDSLVYAAMGLCGESGEASEIIKKYVYQGHDLDVKHLASELGDVLWYVTYAADILGLSLEDLMSINREKLSKRYPEGVFDSQESRNRKEDDI